jgi:hypothetical protein
MKGRTNRHESQRAPPCVVQPKTAKFSALSRKGASRSDGGNKPYPLIDCSDFERVTVSESRLGVTNPLASWFLCTTSSPRLTPTTGLSLM